MCSTRARNAQVTKLFLIILCVLSPIKNIYATAYTFAGTLSPSPPLAFPANPLTLINGDTLSLTSGTMTVLTPDSFTGTVISTTAATESITLSTGAILTFGSSLANKAAINMTGGGNYTILNNGGTISTNGATAISIASGTVNLTTQGNTTGGSILGAVALGTSTGQVNIKGTGGITGALSFSGAVALAIDGITGQTNGTISGAITGGPGSSFLIGTQVTNTNIILGSTVASIPTITLGLANGTQHGHLTTGGAITGVITALAVNLNSNLSLLHVISGTGTTSVGGTMQIGVTNAHSMSGALTTAATGVILVNAAWTPAAATFSHAGSLRIADGAIFTPSGGFTNSNSGETILSGTGAYNGPWTGLNGATLILNSTGKVSGNIITIPGTSVTITTSYTFPATSIFTNGGTTVIGLGGTLTTPTSYTNNGTTTLSGVDTTVGSITTFGGKIVGAYSGGSGSIFNINGSGSINGDLTLGASSVINFNNGILGSVPAPGGITGAISTTSSSIVVGPVTAGSFTTVAAITGLSNLTVTNGTFVNDFGALGVSSTISTAAAGILKLNQPVTGAASINNVGSLYISCDNALTTTGAVTNSGTIFVTDSAVFTQPTLFTSTNTTTLTDSGSINGAYVTGNGSILNLNGAGSVNGAYTAGNNAFINLAGKGGITGGTIMGASATINISNTSTNNGILANSVRVGDNSTINFYNGSIGGGGISGSIGTAVGASNTLTMNIGTVSGPNPIAGNFTTKAAIGGLSNLNIVSGSFSNNFAAITINSPGAVVVSTNGILNLTKAITGTAPLTNAGIVNVYAVNTLATTAAFNNNGILNIYSSLTPATSSFTNNGPAAPIGTINIYSGGIFTKPATFTNTGITYVDGTGTIAGAYTGGVGSIFNIGINTDTTNFSTSGIFSGIPTINVLKGTFNVNNAVTGVNTFVVGAGTKAILNANFGNSAVSTTNNSVLTINSANALGGGTGGQILNNTANGKLNISNTFTRANYATFTNSGAVFVYTNGANVGNVVGALAGDGSTTSTLSIGTDSTGFNIYSSTNYATSGAISGFPTVHIYGGTFNVGNNLSGVSNFTIDFGSTYTQSAGTFALNNTTINNNGTATFSSGFSFAGTNALNTNIGATSTFNTTALNTTAFTQFTNYGTINIDGINMTTSTAFANNGIINILNAGEISNSFNSGGNSVINLNGPGVAGVAVVGPFTAGGNSAININNTGTITGGVNLGYGSTINFNQPSGVGIVGAITLLGGRINIGPVSASTYTTTAAGVSGLSYLTVTNGTFTHAAIGPNPLIVDTQVKVLAAGVLTLNQVLQGTGTFDNAGIVNVSGTTFSTTGFARSATSSGVINVSNGSLTVDSNFINTGAIRLNTGAGVGTINGALVGGSGSSLTVGFSAPNTTATSATITGIQTITVNNSSTYTINNPISGVNTAFNINNTGGASTVILNENLSGTGIMSISTGSTLRLNTGSSVNNFSVVNNDGGIIRANGTSSINANITNSSLTAGARLLVGADATATFITNGTISDIQTITISNASSFTANNPIFGVTAASTGFTVGVGSTASFNAGLTGTGALQNDGNIITVAPINMISYSDTVTSTFTAASNDGVKFGSLNTQNTINFSGKLIVQSAVTPIDVPQKFVIIAGGPGSVMPIASQITIPPNTFLNQWTLDLTNPNLVAVNNVRHELAKKNEMFSGILDVMYANYVNGNINPLQSAIINAILNSGANFNDVIHKFLPTANSVAPPMVIHNGAINKIEMRVSALRDGGRMSPGTVGVNAGELSPDTSMWIGNFGSITNQQVMDQNEGYKAKSVGILLGFDTNFCRDNIMGIAVGTSHAGINEYSNQAFSTKIHSTHLLLYGTQNYEDLNYLDWMATGSFNKNRGSRSIITNGLDLSTQSQYNSYQAALRLIRGKSFEVFDSYRFTPLTTFQYGMLHRAAYNERGGAALHVAQQNKNIVTLGLGAKFGFPIDAWRMIGMREIKAVLTYDVLNNRNIIKANFISGGGDFSLYDSPSRLGLKLGAGMTFEMAENLQLQLHYDFEMRRKFTDHTGVLKLRYLF